MEQETNDSEDVKAIKPINKDTVHKICSGQVVLNLAVAVKELVENSLDAGASNVDVRLKNYGIDLIEVSDNGCGVTEENFSALTLKYHTSKLSEYSDLLGVSSFGFRGEALSSLCELADLTVTTRHHSSDYATKIEYDHKGNIVKKSLCARQVGTTVSLTNLFASLPVRLKEFHKNAKREFNKMTQLLYAYCLISVGVKIHCTNQTSSNATSTVVATQGSTSYKDNIACVFGYKQLQSLLELKPEYTPNIKDNILKGLSGEEKTDNCDANLEDVEIDLSEDSNDTQILDSQEDPCSQLSTRSQGHKNSVCPVAFIGLISSCAHGSGRSSSDRQFYFVNSRPCEPPKVSKLINEVYRQYNPNQYPFVFLNINLDRTSVDINVTPDKRKVFLTMEKVVLDVIKSSMLKLFESIPRTLKVETLSGTLKNKVQPEVDQPRVFQSFLQKFASDSSKIPKEAARGRELKSDEVDLKRKSATMLDFVSAKTRRVSSPEQDVNQSLKEIEKDRTLIKIKVFDIEEGSPYNSEDNRSNSSVTSSNSHNGSNITENIVIADKDKQIHDSGNEIIYLESDNVPNTQIRTLNDIVEKSHTIICKNKTRPPVCSPITENKTRPVSSPVKKTNSSAKEVLTDVEDRGKLNKRAVQMKTSLEQVTALAEIYNNNKKDSAQAPERIKFRSQINPALNPKCEEELSREISKDSFKQMAVIGQFNLGFIITKLDDDLFIIDQHATDEIYNFESLQKNTELSSQKLVCPQKLELSGVNEQILMDNLSVFKKNGFTFAIDQDASPCHRVKLLTIPMSKNWVFGKSDIEELLFMLRESPSGHCRPSRVRCMFASRACRKSVMVGTALAKADMRRLVDHMADIDKPWNCPHGRPTIRHLVNLAMVHTKTSAQEES